MRTTKHLYVLKYSNHILQKCSRCMYISLPVDPSLLTLCFSTCLSKTSKTSFTSSSSSLGVLRLMNVLKLLMSAIITVTDSKLSGSTILFCIRFAIFAGTSWDNKVSVRFCSFSRWTVFSCKHSFTSAMFFEIL